MFNLYVKCDYGTSTQSASPNDLTAVPNGVQAPSKEYGPISAMGMTSSIDTLLSNRWYAVMASPVQDQECCNYLTNTKDPCKCMGADFTPLGNNEWLLYTFALNKQSMEEVIDIGAWSIAPNASTLEIDSILLSSAVMPTDAISGYFTNVQVTGNGNFKTFQTRILATDENNFMITQHILGSQETIIIVWARQPMPGKEKVWVCVTQKMKALGVNTRDLVFIDQQGCNYPQKNIPYDIFFCV
ncbi:uncharacterized protein LOC126833984 isoform X2 [Adelges cooleyi]|uniref:uncharacterized protein LOC126833984 isoform X2 n=1 Tax=Adelges cooleyi TaxID=133065 RepID=UPI00217F604D|nr:uncharacterized protein LOC126833984 isoform X2 [Adelges cooleyi]